MIPHSGNCGLSAFSLILRDNYHHILKLDDLRHSVNLQPLFEYPSASRTRKITDDALKRKFLKHFDWMSYLCLHYAEMLDENSSVIENLLHSDGQISKLCDIYKFDKNHAAHPCKNEQKVQSEYNKLKEYYRDTSRQDELFADYNHLYCKSVARYCLELCLFQGKLDLKIVEKARKIYFFESKRCGKIWMLLDRFMRN